MGGKTSVTLPNNVDAEGDAVVLLVDDDGQGHNEVVVFKS